MKRRLYTANELAKMLKVAPRTIYSWARRGEIECFRIGRQVRFYDPTEERTKWN